MLLIDDKHHKIVQKWLNNDSGLTIEKVRLRIKKEMGIVASKSTVHRLMGASKNPPNPNSTLNQKLLPHQTLDLSEFARN